MLETWQVQYVPSLLLGYGQWLHPPHSNHGCQMGSDESEAAPRAAPSSSATFLLPTIPTSLGLDATE